MFELNIDAFDEFTCIGSDCEDHCCKDWNIYLEKAAYDTYASVEDEEFKKLFDFGVEKLKYATKIKYAYMKLNKNRECVFLSDDNLCGVYKKLGADNMCTVCKVYPRNPVFLGDIIENSIQLSCPEACRKVLFRENPIEFTLTEVDTPSTTVVGKRLLFNQKGCFSKDMYNELRSFIIGAIQNRDYTIEERLMIVGFLLSDIKGKSELEIFKIIAQYASGVANNQFKGCCDGVDRSSVIGAEIKLAMDVYLKVVSMINIDKAQKNLTNVREGLNIDNAVEFKELKDNYSYVKDTYYKNYITGKEYIFENYLVNYIFSNNFTYYKKDIFKNFSEMLVYYCMIKFSIISTCGRLKDDVTDNDINRAIFTFVRGTGHSERARKKLLGVIDDLKLDNMTALFPLVLM